MCPKITPDKKPGPKPLPEYTLKRRRGKQTLVHRQILLWQRKMAKLAALESQKVPQNVTVDKVDVVEEPEPEPANLWGMFK